MFGVVDKDSNIDNAVRQEWILRQFKKYTFNEALLIIQKYKGEQERLMEYSRDRLNRTVYDYQPIERKFKGA